MKIWRIDWSLIWAVVYLSTAYFQRLIASSCGLTQRFKKRFATVAGPLVLSARRRYWFGRATGTRPSSFQRLSQSCLRQGQWRAALPVDGGDRCPGAVLSSAAQWRAALPVDDGDRCPDAVLSSVAARLNRKRDGVPCVSSLGTPALSSLYVQGS